MFGTKGLEIRFHRKSRIFPVQETIFLEIVFEKFIVKILGFAQNFKKTPGEKNTQNKIKRFIWLSPG